MFPDNYKILNQHWDNASNSPQSAAKGDEGNQFLKLTEKQKSHRPLKHMKE